jgi:hypothetical protein
VLFHDLYSVRQLWLTVTYLIHDGYYLTCYRCIVDIMSLTQSVIACRYCVWMKLLCYCAVCHPSKDIVTMKVKDHTIPLSTKCKCSHSQRHSYVVTERNDTLRQGHNTVEPRFTNASHHEQIGSRTNFPEKKLLGWRTVSRVTNTQADNNGWRQAGSIGGRASVAVKLSLSTHGFDLRTFRVTNGLQERIKFVNRGSTVSTMHL